MKSQIFSSDTASSEISSAYCVSMLGCHVLSLACLGCHSKYSLANLSIYIQCRLQSKEESQRKKINFPALDLGFHHFSLSLPLCLPLFLFHPGFLCSPSLAVELGKDKWKIEKEKLDDGKRVQRRLWMGGIGLSVDVMLCVCTCVCLWTRVR